MKRGSNHEAKPEEFVRSADHGLVAGCHSPVEPGIGGDSERPGYTLTILFPTPDARATIDHIDGIRLARVRVGFERPAGATSTRLVVCLAPTTSTFIFSSCRDTRLLVAKGEAEGYAGIYYLTNGGPARSETRYILALLVAGDLVHNRRMYEDEIGIDRLSEGVFAFQPVTNAER